MCSGFGGLKIGKLKNGKMENGKAFFDGASQPTDTVLAYRTNLAPHLPDARARFI